MKQDGMLDYRQSQTSTSLAAGATFIHSIESLEKPREVLFINTDAVIFENDTTLFKIVLCQCNMDSPAF